MADDEVDVGFLRRSARDYLASLGGASTLRGLADLDWTGLLVDEQRGGSGWRPVETCVIAEELGRATDGSSWTGTVLAAAAVAGAAAPIRDRWLPDLLRGDAAAAFTLAAPTVRVVNGDQVDLVVVAGDDDVRLIERDRFVCLRDDVDSLDTTRSSQLIDVAGADGVIVGDREQSARLVAVAQTMISADAVGVLAGARERLVAYLRDRIAFGVPIASFQAIQHRLVDLLVFEVKARAIVAKAARAHAGADSGADHAVAVALSATAHAFVAAGVTKAVDECMQLSGGIGFTWEYPLHHELRRASADAWLLGTARSSRGTLADVSGW